MDNYLRVNTFVSILINIMNSKIKFNRTKEQPLIPNQSLMQPNKFKHTFREFLSSFGVGLQEIHLSSLRPNKSDKQRSNKIVGVYMDKLLEIQKQMTISKNIKLFNLPFGISSPNKFDFTSIIDTYNESEMNDSVDHQDKLSLSTLSDVSVLSEFDNISPIQPISLQCPTQSPIYSIFVPLSMSNIIGIEYQFLSFHPLRIQQRVVTV